MADSNYGKFIITELKNKEEASWAPKFTEDEKTHVLFLDSRVLPGAFYVEVVWHLIPPQEERLGKSHVHDFDEVIAFLGGDPQNPHDLYGEIEIHLGGEIHKITKSCLIFIPKGTSNGPIYFNKIERPILHFACGTSTNYL